MTSGQFPKRSLALLAATIALAASLTARAQDCAVPEGANPRLAAVPAALRLAFLRDALNHDAKNALIWKWAWTGGYVVAAAGELFIGPLILSPADRNQAYVGAVASGIAALPLVAFPLQVGTDGPTFDSQVATSNPAETCTLIRLGEQLVLRDAANEAAGVGWIMQVVNAAYNVVVAAVLGWGFHYSWSTALIAGIAGEAVGEGMILTQPTHLNDSWKSYQNGAFGKDGAGSGDGFPQLTFAPPPNSSVGLTLKF